MKKKIILSSKGNLRLKINDQFLFPLDQKRESFTFTQDSLLQKIYIKIMFRVMLKKNKNLDYFLVNIEVICLNFTKFL